MEAAILRMLSGVAVIAKMAKVRIMPVTYTGPMALKGLATCEQVDMNFGAPIDISDVAKMNDEGSGRSCKTNQAEFDHLRCGISALRNDRKPFILIRLLKFLLLPFVLVATDPLVLVISPVCMGSG